MLTMETVIHDLRENGSSIPQDIADRVGVDATVVRSHLNRYRNQRYRLLDETGEWELIGKNGNAPEEEDDE
jgi:hypothetical protein